MFRATGLATALVSLGLLYAAPATAQDGNQTYNFYCAACHGNDGKGHGPNVTKDFPVDPKNFTNATEMNKLSDDDIRTVILEGGPGVSKSLLMPHWSKTLNDHQVDEMIRIIREFSGGKEKQA